MEAKPLLAAALIGIAGCDNPNDYLDPAQKKEILEAAVDFDGMNKSISTNDGKDFIPCADIEAQLDGIGEKVLTTMEGIKARPGAQCITVEWQLRPGRGSVNRDTVFDDTSESGDSRHVYVRGYKPLRFEEKNSSTPCTVDSVIVQLSIVPSQSMSSCEDNPSAYKFSGIGN